MKVEFRDLSFCYDDKKELALIESQLLVSTSDCIVSVLDGKSGCGNGLIPEFYNSRLTGSCNF